MKQQCQKGYEYWVGISRTGQDEIVVTKKPPTGANENSLPSGIVRYNDGRGGYVSLTCKEGTSVQASIPPGTILHYGGLNPATLPTAQSAVSPSGVYTNGEVGSFGSTDSGSGAFVPGGALYNVPAQDLSLPQAPDLQPDLTAGTNAPKSIGEIDQQIQEDAQKNIQSDPKLRDNAFQMQLCQQQGTCDVGTIESSNPLSQEQQLREQAQQGVRQDYLKAINGAYGSDFSVNPLGDKSVDVVSNPSWGARYYDSETGQPFLGYAVGETGPTLLTSAGAVPTSGPVSEWQGAMQSTIDSPTKFQAFESEYFDDGGAPQSYSLTASPDCISEDCSMSAVLVHDIVGDKTIPLDAYSAVREQGDAVFGTDQVRTQISDMTGGKVQFDAPDSFPTETLRNTGISPSGSMTPLSETGRAIAINSAAEVLSNYPPQYWSNANPVNMYEYGQNPAAPPLSSSGYSNSYTGVIWLNGTDPTALDFKETINHELTHFNDVQLFGSDQKWAETIYGPQYGSAYAGTSGAEAITSGKLGTIAGRPEGFAVDYGYLGGIKEDQATVVESMFTNYGAVESAAQSDPTLAAKVQLAKQGFSNMSSGVMNDAYWQNLKPIDPTFTLPPTPAPTFFSSFIKALTSGVGGL